MRPTRSPSRALWLALALIPALAFAQPYSDALKARRPAGGEWFGLYLMDKKIGYVFNDLTFAMGSRDKLVSTNELVFKANVSSKVTERHHKEIRVYEAKPNGRLLSFHIEDHGDGGDQVLDGTCTPKGMTVVRKRPNLPDEVLHRPPSPERVEDADQVRVAILRGKDVAGRTTDGSDLESYALTTKLLPPEVRTIGGVKLTLRRAVSVSEKEKVPATAYVTESGKTVEIDFGQVMQARAEPKEIAQKLDEVEVFGLTRVVLPKPPPEDVRRIPGKLGLVVTGLDARFFKNSYRQRFQARDDGKVDVTLLGVAPDPAKLAQLPITAPELRAYLKSTLAVEASDTKIRKAAKRIVGKEKDAWAAAKKISQWVSEHVESDYGVSADRATDVLRQRKGDCTEHALLAEALMRAAGIPARRVDGLIYVMNTDGVPALYWHEWVEAYVGQWTQLDPTFAQPVADATHLALGNEGNAEITPLIGSLKVLEVR